MALLPRRAKYLVALAFLAGLALGGFLPKSDFLLRWFKGDYEIALLLDQAPGVTPKTEVRIAGVTIGRVSGQPELNADGKVKVPLSIRQDVHIPVGASIHVVTTSLLGDQSIVITPPAERTGQFIAHGATVIGSIDSGFNTPSGSLLKLLAPVPATPKSE